MEIFAYRWLGEQQTVEDARREIENSGYGITRWFADETAGGPRSRAQQFSDMLRQMRAGDTLLVTKLHQLGVNAEDVLVTIKALDARQAGLIVLELGKANLLSEAGRLVLGTLAAVVDMERNRPGPRPPRPAPKRRERAKKLPRELRAKIITDYCHGVGVAELARRYDISRPRIQEVVDPKRKDDEPLPFAWGD